MPRRKLIQTVRKAVKTRAATGLQQRQKTKVKASMVKTSSLVRAPVMQRRKAKMNHQLRQKMMMRVKMMKSIPIVKTRNLLLKKKIPRSLLGF